MARSKNLAMGIKAASSYSWAPRSCDTMLLTTKEFYSRYFLCLWVIIAVLAFTIEAKTKNAAGKTLNQRSDSEEKLYSNYIFYFLYQREKRLVQEL